MGQTVKRGKVDTNSAKTRNKREFSRIMAQTGQPPLNRAQRRAAKKAGNS